MSTYRIRHFIGKDIGRKFPQVKDGTEDFNVQSSDYIGNFFLKPITGNPVLPKLILWDSAKLTDLVSSSFIGTSEGLIISHKLKSILDNFLPSSIDILPITLIHKGNVFDNYYYLHPSRTDNDFIDFPSSEIWLFKNLIKNERRFYNDAKSFYQEAYQLRYPLMLSIVSFKLKDSADFFVLNYVDGGIGFFVSERLKKAIEGAACNGVVFTDLNERYP